MKRHPCNQAVLNPPEWVCGDEHRSRPFYRLFSGQKYSRAQAAGKKTTKRLKENDDET
jgi:ribosomal protein L15E